MSGSTRLAAALRLVALATLVLVYGSRVVSAQSENDESLTASQIVPDWLSAESAASLDVGIAVLLPEALPGPFEGEPGITVYGGYYSLYWLIPGSPPTYLQINGELGGEIPDFSWYDRNVELEVNAEVQGFPAYHDFTPIYDLVYWQVADVVYSVESANLTDTDSLTLANSLASLAIETTRPIETPDESPGESVDEIAEPAVTVPETIAAGDIVSVEVSNANGATLTASIGTFLDSGSDAIESVFEGTFDWRAPDATEDTYARFLLIERESQEWLAVGESTVIGSHIPTTASLSCPTPLDPEVVTPITLTGSSTITIEATGGSFPPNPRNLDFAPDADGGSSLTGTVTESGAVDVFWQAPWVDEDTVFTIFATDADGVTLAACDITLVAYVPPTEAIDEPGGGNGEELPGAPPEEPTEVPIEEPIEAPREEPIDEPAEEPIEEQPEQPVEDSAEVVVEGENEVVEVESAGAVEDEAAVAETSAEILQTIRTPQPTATSKPATAAPTSSPTVAPSPSTTPRPTATGIPVTGPDGMVAQVIGPEGGQLSHPAGATLMIPAMALSDEATVTIMSIDDASLPVSDRVDFFPQSGFDIAIADATGRPIDFLAKPATLKVALKPEQWRRETVIYWINQSKPEVLSDVQLTDAEVSASLDHFSRFAAGVPITGSERSNLLIRLIAAVVAMMIFAVCYGIYSSSRRHRSLSVGPRRVPARHRRP